MIELDERFDGFESRIATLFCEAEVAGGIVGFPVTRAQCDPV